jgi:lipoprotein-releasing system permease protein
MRIIMFVFLLLTGFMLLLIFNGIVAEKVRDIGALRALGASPAGILKCFLMQALFIGGVGVIVGMMAAPILLYCLNHYASIRHLFYANLDEIPHITLGFDRLAIAISSLLSALAGVAYPAWRASRMNPVECLRHE